VCAVLCGAVVKADAMEREVQAVDSEFNISLQSDVCRVQQLQCSTCVQPDHPFRKFSWGNRKSLIDDPAKLGVDMRERLLQLYSRFYTAGAMRLVVVGGEPLDTLELWVRQLFSPIPPGGSGIHPLLHQLPPPATFSPPSQDSEMLGPGAAGLEQEEGGAGEVVGGGNGSSAAAAAAAAAAGDGDGAAGADGGGAVAATARTKGPLAAVLAGSRAASEVSTAATAGTAATAATAVAVPGMQMGTTETSAAKGEKGKGDKAEEAEVGDGDGGQWRGVWEAGRLYEVASVKEQQQVSLMWTLPCLHAEYASKPHDYLSHLIGHESSGSLLSLLKAKGWATELALLPPSLLHHPLLFLPHSHSSPSTEGSGSLLSLLKAKGWATELAAGVGESGYEKSSLAFVFTVTITLSDDGLKHYMSMLRQAVLQLPHSLTCCPPPRTHRLPPHQALDVVGTVFQYITMLRLAPPLRWALDVVGTVFQYNTMLRLAPPQRWALDVVGTVFQYITMLRLAPPQRWVFEELQAIAAMDLRFAEEDSPDEYARWVFEELQAIAAMDLRFAEEDSPDEYVCGRAVAALPPPSQRWMFEELQAIAAMDLRFTEDFPDEYAVRLAGNMFYYPKKRVIARDHIFFPLLPVPPPSPSLPLPGNLPQAACNSRGPHSRQVGTPSHCPPALSSLPALSALTAPLSLPGNMFYYPKRHVIAGDYIHDKWDPDRIAYLLSLLSPHSVRLDLLTHSFDHTREGILKEPWFDVPYTTTLLSPALLDQWASDTWLSPDLRMPPPNEFIPTDFSLCPSSTAAASATTTTTATTATASTTTVAATNSSDPLNGTTPSAVSAPSAPSVPRLVREEAGRCKVWFKQDDVFRSPRLNAHFALSSPHACDSPRSAALTELAVKLIEDSLNETLYLASVAKLDTNMAVQGCKIEIRITGFSHKLPTLAACIFRHISMFRAAADRFSALKEERCRAYRNALLKPLKHSAYLRLLLLRTPAWTIPDKLSALTACEVDDLNAFLQNLFSRTYIEMLIHGNATEEDALALASAVTDTLPVPSPPLLDLPSERCLQLPCGKSLLVESPVGNPAEENSAVEVMSEPLFDTLRTKEQLGYRVDCGTRLTHGVFGFCIRVQSADYGPGFLQQRVDSFLNAFRDNLSALPEADFRAHRAALQVLKMRKDHTLGDETHRYWEQIWEGSSLFNSRQLEAVALCNITLAELCAWFDRHISMTAGADSDRGDGADKDSIMGENGEAGALEAGNGEAYKGDGNGDGGGKVLGRRVLVHVWGAGKWKERSEVSTGETGKEAAGKAGKAVKNGKGGGWREGQVVVEVGDIEKEKASLELFPVLKPVVVTA
ncbi:unnamed protein product, partial [Closterium sp. NIES-64]